MPTFKYTLSEDEIWAIVAYVRTLHGMKLTYDLEARKKEVQEKQQSAQQAFDQTKQALEVADKKASDEAEKKGVEVDDAATVKEQEAFGAASKELEKAKVLATSFSTRPKAPSTPRPDLTIAPEQAAKLPMWENVSTPIVSAMRVIVSVKKAASSAQHWIGLDFV